MNCSAPAPRQTFKRRAAPRFDMQLLLRQQAAAEWGWVAGLMCFCHSEEEEYLLELLEYIWRGRRRAWEVAPLFRDKHAGDELEWFFERTDALETFWDFRTADDAHDTRGLLERERLKMLYVPIRRGEDLCERLGVIVFHSVCRNTLAAFYYLNVGCWFARCASVQECVALLDAIAASKDRLLAGQSLYHDCRALVLSLQRAAQRERDPIRLAHLRRKMGEARAEAAGLRRVAL
jgi:hypothetical protein